MGWRTRARDRVHEMDLGASYGVGVSSGTAVTQRCRYGIPRSRRAVEQPCLSLQTHALPTVQTERQRACCQQPEREASDHLASPALSRSGGLLAAQLGACSLHWPPSACVFHVLQLGSPFSRQTLDWLPLPGRNCHKHGGRGTVQRVPSEMKSLLPESSIPCRGTAQQERTARGLRVSRARTDATRRSDGMACI